MCHWFIQWAVRSDRSCSTSISDQTAACPVLLRFDGPDNLVSTRCQWEAGQANAEKVSELRESLATLMERSSKVGWNEATKQVAVSRFFSEIGQVLNISVEKVRLAG